MKKYFYRKAYRQLLDWKNNYADSYAVLLEGARRVGKTTIVRQFAEKEYDSYIMIDFSNASPDITSCFDDISDLDMFFLRLQAVTGVSLTAHRSVIIFDEVQLFPKARQAIKHLVSDGRYHYIETGSLISINKNVRDILIPSEEKKIQVYPMDYEEFMLACGNSTFDLLGKLFRSMKPAGQQTNRKLMRDFRLYMAVGGMPQAVEAYLDRHDFSQIDEVKREIISLYEDDFRKIDPSGRISMLYHSIPAQLSREKRRFSLNLATGKRQTKKTRDLLYELIDSKTVLISYNSTDPRVSLSLTRDLDSYKMYLADTGLFVTLMFIDRPTVENEIYAKLMSDKLPANLGYLYENAVAQTIAASGRELYYHTWKKKNSTHNYEIDFLISDRTKVIPVEVKSSGLGKHESLNVFMEKYSDVVSGAYVISQKDISSKNGKKFVPVYLTSFIGI